MMNRFTPRITCRANPDHVLTALAIVVATFDALALAAFMIVIMRSA